MPQRLFGRGPKGYRRSDERIWEEVCERLTDDPDVDATEMEVVVNDGEVTLTGHAGTRAEKRWAERIAERVRGVADVHNLLRVRREVGSFGGQLGLSATTRGADVQRPLGDDVGGRGRR